MVGVARLELTTPRSQSECATNCATPRQISNILKIEVMYRFFCCSASFITNHSFLNRAPYFAKATKGWPAIRPCPPKLYAKEEALRVVWGEWWGSNPRPPEPQPGALPTELHSPQI